MKFNNVLIATLLLASSVTVCTSARAADVDWKIYGSITVDAGPQYCFYELRGAVETPERHVRVWTKCLPRKAIDAIDKEKEFDGSIVRNAARKFIDKYTPPIASVEILDREDLMLFTLYEETANLSGIQPTIRVYYELDCARSMLRELSIDVLKADGGITSGRNEREWKYIAPETNGQRLQALLCGKAN